MDAGSEAAVLASAAAGRLVEVLATDGWSAVKDSVASLWRHSHPERVDTELARSRRELLLASPQETADVHAMLAAQWQARITELLISRPAIADEVCGLLREELRAAASAGRQQIGSMTLEAHVSGGGDAFQAGRDLHLHHDHETRRTRASPDAKDVLCPYPGLASFGNHYQRWFYGRDQMVAAVCERLDARLRDGGPLILIGTSGAGKSSLLAAGVLPALARGGLPVDGSSRWPQLTLTPTSTPALALATAAGLAAEAAQHAAQAWRSDPSRCLAELHKIADVNVEAGSAGLVVVVDQFEELFTACTDDADRQWFVQVLHALAQPEGKAAVVLGVRADFYAACTAYPELRSALRAGPLLLDPMTEAELKQAIRLPASDVGLEVEDGLVELLLADIGTEKDLAGASAAGRLPFLAHALRATWQQRSGHTLTVDGYRATGRIQHAIATTADRLFDGLPPKGKEAARWVFLRLVIVGRDTDDTRRRVPYEGLLHDAPEPALAAEVVDVFTGGRLLSRDQDTVAITHEALIRAWPRLREWIEQDRAGNLLRQELEEASDTWERTAHEPSALYRGTRLETASAWAKTHEADLSATAGAFLASSRRHQRRGQRFRRFAVIALTILAVVASAGLAASTVYQRRAAQAQQHQLAQFLAAEADDLRGSQPGLAKQLSLLAYRYDPQAGRDALLNSQRTPGTIGGQQPAFDLASDTGGRVLAVSTGDGITLRDLHGGLTGRINGLRTGPITLTRDGEFLAAADIGTDAKAAAATLRLWNVSDLAHPSQIATLHVASGISALAVSGDGKTLFAGTAAGVVRRWSLGDPTAPAPLSDLTVGSRDVDSLATSPNRDLLATASGTTVRLWNAAGSVRPTVLGTADNGVDVKDEEVMGTPLPMHRVAFDRTGDIMAFGDTGNIPVLWDLHKSLTPVPLPTSSEGTNSAGLGNCNASLTEVSFSPAANQITGRCGENWYIWIYLTAPDANGVRLGATQENGADYSNRAIMFDPSDPHRLLNATSRGIEVWDVTNPYEPGATAFVASRAADTGFFGDLVMAHDGRRQLAAIHDGSTNVMWDITDPASARRLLENTAFPRDQGLALSANGQLLADGEPCDGAYACVRLHDTTSAARTLSTINLDGDVGPIAFSPTKPILAVAAGALLAGDGSAQQSVRIYDIADPTHPRQIAQMTAGPSQLIFSPDGLTLVAEDYSDSNLAQLDNETYIPLMRSWSMSDPSHPVQMWMHPAPASNATDALAFNPAGTVLASYGDQGTLSLWQVRQDRLVGDPVTVSVGSGVAGPELAFSPDGSQIVLLNTPPGESSTSSDVRVEVWDVADAASPTLRFYLPVITNVFEPPLPAFTPDDNSLAVYRQGSGIDFWDIDPRDVATRLCASAGDPITLQEWQRYLPGRTYKPPCSGRE